MKFSEAWLREWVNPSCDGETLLASVAMAGIEIESIEPIDCGFAGVVVGRVDSVEPHPNADRLRVCQVFDGQKHLQVVCGAANVRAGMLVPFAQLGASLKGGELRIKAAKLRGVESAGMLCSAAELNIATESSGLLELPADTTVGAAIADLFAVQDRVIEVGLTPNRGDCLSMRGVAREVGVLFSTPVVGPALERVPATIATTVEVTLAAPDACPRYLGRVIQGVDLSRPTPLWLRERLRRGGMRSIDPAVDVTNYAMLELGQPLHAFDLSRLRGGITVRWAHAGEQLEMLDGKQLELRDNTLVIADEDGAVAMAGIMGGARSAMQADAPNAGAAKARLHDVFLESAFFAPAAIRGRARAYGMHTEASQRFERGVDFALPEHAIERATALLISIAGGAPGPVVATEAPVHLPRREPILLRHARLARLIGVDVPGAVVVATLEGLGMHVRAHTGSELSWAVAAPSYRFDMEREQDLVEEVCRIYGYDRIPSASPVTSLELVSEDPFRVKLHGLRRLLVGLGYQEAITYSFLDPTSQDLFAPGIMPIRLDNPLSAEMSVLRTDLLAGLVRAALYNRNRQAARSKLFEIGRCFVRTGASIAQPWRVSGVLVGARSPEGWAGGREAFDYFDAKGDVERLLGFAASFAALTDDPAFHPGQAALISTAGGLHLGRVGRIHPAVLAQLDFDASVLAFELDVNALLVPVTSEYVPPSMFPSVRRDLAVLVDRGVQADAVEAAVRAAAAELLTQFTLFDVYAGEGIDSSKKSIGLGLTLQHPSRTLEEAEVNALVGVVMGRLNSQLGAVQR